MKLYLSKFPFSLINLGSLLAGGGERKLTKIRSKALEVKGRRFQTNEMVSSRQTIYNIHILLCRSVPRSDLSFIHSYVRPFVRSHALSLVPAFIYLFLFPYIRSFIALLAGLPMQNTCTLMGESFILQTTMNFTTSCFL